MSKIFKLGCLRSLEFAKNILNEFIIEILKLSFNNIPKFCFFLNLNIFLRNKNINFGRPKLLNTLKF